MIFFSFRLENNQTTSYDIESYVVIIFFVSMNKY